MDQSNAIILASHPWLKKNLFSTKDRQTMLCTDFGLTWDIVPIYIALRSDMPITANKEKPGRGIMFIP
jgi:hypothetical protein